MARRRHTRTRAAALTLVAVLMTVTVAVTAPGPAAAAQTLATPYSVYIPLSDLSFSPGAGALTEDGQNAMLWSTGSASVAVTTTSFVHHVDVGLRAEQCDGAPHVALVADGTTMISQAVFGTGRYGAILNWPPGHHRLSLRFLDDHRSASCDRNVSLSALNLLGMPYKADQPVGTYQSMRMRYAELEPPSAGHVTPSYARLWNNGTLRLRLDSQLATGLDLYVTSVRCAGWAPHLRITLDGEVVFDGPADRLTSSWRPGIHLNDLFQLHRRFSDGPHLIDLTMSKDLMTPTCDRGLTLHYAEFDGILSAPAPAPTAERS